MLHLRCFSTSSIRLCRISEQHPILTHLFPIHPFSTPYGFLRFSGGRERVHWEQEGTFFRKKVIKFASTPPVINTIVGILQRGKFLYLFLGEGVVVEGRMLILFKLVTNDVFCSYAISFFLVLKANQVMLTCLIV